MTTSPTEPTPPAPHAAPDAGEVGSAALSPEEARARAAANKQGALGVIVAVVGGLALVLRYIVWPMGELPGWVTGGLIGLTIAGLTIERQRRKTLELPWMPGTTLIVAVGLGVVSITIGWFRPDLIAMVGGLNTETRELPGITLELPPWEVSSSDLDARNGELKLAAPDGNGRFVRVRWNVAEASADEQIEAMLIGAGGEIVAKAPIDVGGHEGTRLSIAFPGGKRARVSHWFCPEHRRAHQLWSFLSVSAGALDDMQETLEEGVTCHTPIAGGMPPPKMPGLVAPDGWTREDRLEAAVLTSPDGVFALTVFEMLPDPKIAPTLKGAPELRLNVLRGLLPNVPVTLDDSAGTLLGAAPITVFRGTAGEGDAAEQLLFATYACHRPDGTVVALASAPTGTSTTPVEEILKTATCPR